MRLDREGRRSLRGLQLPETACLVPSMVRTGQAPETGVWKKDRIQLAGYAMLLEDGFGRPVRIGQVEYPRSGEVREVQIWPVDRRGRSGSATV